MVRKWLVVISMLLSASLYGSASISGGLDLYGGYYDGPAGELFDGGIADALLSDSPEFSGFVYYAEPYLAANASSQALKAEIKVSYAIADIKDIGIENFSIERADIRFRFPSFGNRKMTIVLGKSPISWGVGSYYRVGDVMLDSSMHNEEAGTADSRNIWLAEASQAFGSGWSGRIALSLPLEDQALRIGARLAKAFDSSWFKEMYAFYSYGDDIHKAAIAFDLALYFDITLGLESEFRSGRDFHAAVNMMRLFQIQSDSYDHTLGLYIASDLDFYSDRYDLFSAISFEASPRVSLIVSLTNSFSSSLWRGIAAECSLSFIAVESVELKAAGFYGYNCSRALHSYGIIAGVEATF